MDQIELEMATKLILFERKLSKLYKITLKVENINYKEVETELQKAKQTNDWDNFERIYRPKCEVGFLTDISKFDLQIHPKCTVDELAAAIMEVCQKQNYFIHFQRWRSRHKHYREIDSEFAKAVPETKDQNDEFIKIYNEKNEEITERSKSLRELGFGNGAIIKHDLK